MSAGAGTPKRAVPELPILVRKARAWFASFAVPAAPALALVPEPSLRLVRYLPGRTALVVAVFEHLDTSIGPYHEVAIGFPVRHKKSTAVPLLPLLAERWLEDLGPWMYAVAVDAEVAEDAMMRHWGAPTFLAKIDIDTSPGRMRCTVSEAGRPILAVDVTRPSPTAERLHFPLRLWSKLDDELLYTSLDVDAVGCTRKLGAKAELTLEDHGRLAALAAMGVAKAKCIDVRWFDEYRTALDRPRARFRVGAHAR